MLDLYIFSVIAKLIHKSIESLLKIKNMDFRRFLANDFTGDVIKVVEGGCHETLIVLANGHV